MLKKIIKILKRAIKRYKREVEQILLELEQGDGTVVPRNYKGGKK